MTSLDHEQAGMYRWIRKNLTSEMFLHLTGKQLSGLDGLDVDRELRAAYARMSALDASEAIRERSKIRAGLLPKELGEAILDYTFAVLDAGELWETDLEVSFCMKLLCEQMAKLR